jgi:hypothetical protein
MTNEQPSIKILRMQTGEDIISSIQEDDKNETILLNNPMKVVIKRDVSGSTIFVMLPWLPIEIIKEDAAIVYTSDVITMVEPRDSLIEYYNNAVNDSLLTMIRSSREIEDALLEIEEGEEDYEEEITEEEIKELEEYKRNKLVH